jgi:DNA-binding CsgD family transcriptional regulator
MKLGKPVDFTYQGFLHTIRYANDAVDTSEIVDLLQQYAQGADALPDMMPMFYAIDYRSLNYLFFSDNSKAVAGYDHRQLLNEGPQLSLYVQKKQSVEYFNTLMQKVYPDIFNFLQTIPQPEHIHYTFYTNYFIQDAEGKGMHLWQRSRYMTSPNTGLPLYSLSTAVDITALKNDNLMHCRIERFNPQTGKTEVVFQKVYYPFEEDKLLTLKETQVLQLLADGLSSKMIAHQLGISENTVTNHRQNMLRKTETVNVAQLIAFAVRNRLI